MANTDGNDQGDWFSQNAQTQTATGGGPSFDTVNADYQKYLHRALSVSEYEQYYQNQTGYNPGTIANSAEAQANTNKIYGDQGTALTKPDPNATWDPKTESWILPTKKDPTTDPTTDPNNTGGSNRSNGGIGVPTSGFGSAPTPYHSDPNAPQYQGLPTYVPPTWTGGDYVNPTEADLLASPGYGARLAAGLQARERSAAAQGTVLNGGTLKAENRYASDYASNEYQTLRNNTYDAYVQKYKQFTDAAGMDLNARTINANENQNSFQNRTNTYNTANARNLSDYITNVTNNRNSELDYWNRLQDVSSTGAGLAGASR